MRGRSLQQLAEQTFSDLTEAERKLLVCAESGAQTECGHPPNGAPGDPNHPAAAASWGVERSVRAELIAWLGANSRHKRLVHPKGLVVAGAKITGRMDLSALTIPFPLIFFFCYFSDEVRILYSDLLFLCLDGCVIGAGNQAGDVLIGDSVRARALNLRGSTVNGGVNLRGAEISGNIECDGTRIRNPKGTALSLNAARVGSSIFLRNGFGAEGEVNLCGASIGGAFDCSSATFVAPQGGRAVAADDVKIGRKADFSRSAASGAISFVAAEIGSDLAFDGADLGAATVRLERVHIGRSLLLRETGFGAGGFLDLSDASASAVDVDGRSWPVVDRVDLDGFSYGYLRQPDLAPRLLDVVRGASRALSERMNEQQIRAQPYRQLSKVLRDMGYEKEARRALIALEEERDRQEKMSLWRKVGRRFYRVALRYGYEPVKPAVISAIAAFLIGWCCVFLGNRAGLMVATESNASSLVEIGQLNAMLYSLDTLLPIHAFHQAENWWPMAEGWRWCACWPIHPPWGYLLRWWLCLEIAWGWGGVGLIVAGLAGVVRRE